jgi:hypothetical protein
MPPEDLKDPTAWEKYAKAQGAAGFDKSATYAFGIAKSLRGGQELPKNAPELMKLQHQRRVLLMQGHKADSIEVQELNGRIKKLSTDMAQEQRAEIESSMTSATNIKALAGTIGVQFPSDGEYAQAVGSLSRSMTRQFGDKLGMTQQEMDQMIVDSIGEIVATKDEGIGWEDLPFTDHPKALPQEIRVHVFNKLQQMVGITPEEAEPASEEDEEDSVLNDALSKFGGE